MRISSLPLSENLLRETASVVVWKRLGIYFYEENLLFFMEKTFCSSMERTFSSSVRGPSYLSMEVLPPHSSFLLSYEKFMLPSIRKASFLLREYFPLLYENSLLLVYEELPLSEKSFLSFRRRGFPLLREELPFFVRGKLSLFYEGRFREKSLLSCRKRASCLL